MKKIYFFIFIITSLVLLQSCGYKKIYASSNVQFRIDNIEYSENNLNNQIVKILKSFTNSKSVNKYNLALKTKTEKRVVSKDSKGDPQSYVIKIIAEINIFNESNNYTKSFSSQAKYNNDENKFKLKQYEIEIEKQIVEKIIEKILLFLTDI